MKKYEILYIKTVSMHIHKWCGISCQLYKMYKVAITFYNASKLVMQSSENHYVNKSNTVIFTHMEVVNITIH